MNRVTYGFLVAPGAAMLIFSIFMGFVDPGTGNFWNSSAILLFIISLPIAYVSALVFGIPLYYFCKSHNWLNIWQTIICGGLCSMPFASLIIFDFKYGVNFRDIFKWFGYLFISGSITGVIFWLIAVNKTKKL